MTITKIPVRTVFDNFNNPVGLAEFQVGEVIAIAQGGTSANTVANARVNLNVTDSNIRNLFNVSGDLSYNNTTGVFSFTNDQGDIESVTAGNGLTGGGDSGNVTLDVGSGFGITVNADNIQISNTDIRSLFSVAGSGSYNNNTGVFTITGGVESVGGFTGNVSNTEILSSVQSTGFFNTANIVESTNLYFTEARVKNSVSATGSISYNNATGTFSFTQGNSDTVVEGVTNLYFSNARARAAFTAGSGIQLVEGVISVADTIDFGLIDGAVTSSNDLGSI